MRTNTAPWDYEHPFRGYAQPDTTCPICGGPCYSGAIPGGTLYTCLTCDELRVPDALAAEIILAADERYTRKINQP